MSTVQNLKTVITLGGAVDASFGNMAGLVARELGKATKQVESLESDLGTLTRQIRESKLAGADVSLLAKRYQQLDKEIEDARRSAEGFGAVANIGSKFKSATGYVTEVGSAVTGLAKDFVGLVNATNAQSAEQMGLAKSYGMSIEQFNAWGGVAKQAGLTAKNTGDMVKGLSNKFGEFKALGKQSAVSDVFGKLGIEKGMLEGLSEVEQFEFVMHRLEKVSDGQQAASLANMLFGGEGSKVVTYLRDSGESLDDLLGAQKQVNNLTTQGAEGALQYHNALNNVQKSVSSAWQEVAGVVGGVFAPLLDQLGQTVSRAFNANKAGIIEFVTGVVDTSIDLVNTLIEVGGVVNDVVQSFGGWETAGALVGGVLAGKVVLGLASVASGVTTMITTLQTAKTVMISLNAVMAANPVGAVAAAVGLLTTAGILLYQNWDQVTAWFSQAMMWFTTELPAIFSQAGSAITESWQGVTDWFSDKLEWFKTEFPATFEAINNLFDWSPLGMIVRHWEQIPTFFASMWENVTAIFDQSVGAVMKTWERVSGFVAELKFWGDEDESQSPPRKVQPHGYQQPPVGSYEYIGGYGNYAARASTVLSDTELASRGQTTIQNHNTVEKIEVVTQPGQSNEAIGRAVAEKISANSGAMYDYNYSE